MDVLDRPISNYINITLILHYSIGTWFKTRSLAPLAGSVSLTITKADYEIVHMNPLFLNDFRTISGLTCDACAMGGELSCVWRCTIVLPAVLPAGGGAAATTLILNMIESSNAPRQCCVVLGSDHYEKCSV